MHPGFQHQVRPERRIQTQCVGYRRPEEDQTLLAELLRQHGHPHLRDRLRRHKEVRGDGAGAPGGHMTYLFTCHGTDVGGCAGAVVRGEAGGCPHPRVCQQAGPHRIRHLGPDCRGSLLA